jgi:hypothetical protein
MSSFRPSRVTAGVLLGLSLTSLLLLMVVTVGACGGSGGGSFEGTWVYQGPTSAEVVIAKDGDNYTVTTYDEGRQALVMSAAVNGETLRVTEASSEYAGWRQIAMTVSGDKLTMDTPGGKTVWERK